jgi:hypothetical protein
LNNPLHVNHVEIARKHEGDSLVGLFLLLGPLTSGGDNRAEPEFLLSEALLSKKKD